MTTKKRPGWITFAGILMFLVAAFSLVSAIAALTNASWLSDFKGDIGDNLWLMGITDLIIAVGCGFAGYSILKGGKFGYYWAIVFAVVNSVKWFFMLPWLPIMSLVVITLDVIVIFALAINPEWFGFAWLGEYSPPQQYD